MPTYQFRCKEHGDFTRWVSIHDVSTTARCRLCGGRSLKVFTSPRLTKAARPQDVRERALSKDLAAYKTLRNQGVQPKSIDGCHDLAQVAETRTEIEMGRRLPREAVWTGSHIASEMSGKEAGELRRGSQP